MTAPGADHAWWCAAQRRATAWLGHAPGLWLFYREVIPARLRRANLIAVIGTLAAMGLAMPLLGRARWWPGMLLVWMAGHVAWGTVLAWHLPPGPRRDVSPGRPALLGGLRLGRCPACRDRSARTLQRNR